MDRQGSGWIAALVLGVCVGVGIVSGGAAHANDGGIAYGGSPGLLKGHPSVSMTDEVIRIQVKEDKVTVDCRFTFTNHGPACTVRMGFPDSGEGASDPDEEEGEDAMKKPAQTTFDSFQSFVEGKAVPTKLIRADKPGSYWHTKTVRFPAKGVVHIRDVYTQAVGGGIFQIQETSGYAQEIGYVLHTGASWHGPIGRTEVLVNFETSHIKGALRPMALRAVSTRPQEERVVTDKKVLAPNTVVWTGPVAPTVSGKTLRFVRQNWHPTKKDDIFLSFGYMSRNDSANQ